VWSSDNLGQNKMEQLSPIPPKAMMKARRSKSAPFWHHWNGGRGGQDVPFILSKIEASFSSPVSTLYSRNVWDQDSPFGEKDKATCILWLGLSYGSPSNNLDCTVLYMPGLKNPASRQRLYIKLKSFKSYLNERKYYYRSNVGALTHVPRYWIESRQKLCKFILG